MTDIRREFEIEARKHGLRCVVAQVDDAKNPYDTTISNAAFCGYQAGRAHGVDELIAELQSRMMFWDKKVSGEIVEIIRKHLGKE